MQLKNNQKQFQIEKYKSIGFYSAGIFGITLLLVVLNIFTPLRLNTDGIRYLNILEYLKGNLDKNSGAAHDFLPHGYSSYLLLLDKIHLLCAASITLTNIFSVFFSSYVLAKILKIENKLIYYTIVLISFINIKQYTLPISDQVFALLFITGIYFWFYFFKGRLYFIIPALLITMASIYVRTAGIATLMGVILYIIYLNRNKILKRKILSGLIALLIIVFLICFISNLSFFENKIDYIKQLKLEEVIKNPFLIVGRLLIHFQEFGEITLNIPYSKLSAIVHISNFNLSLYLLIALGIISLWIAGKVIIYLKFYSSFVFWALVSYLLMIFLWPFYDTRFLLPIVPLIIYFLFYYLFSSGKVRYPQIAYLLVYASFGLISLAYSDALSLNKTFFLNHYGFDPVLTNDYKIHFENEKLNVADKPVYDINKDDVLYLLEEYDRKPLIPHAPAK